MGNTYPSVKGLAIVIITVVGLLNELSDSAFRRNNLLK